MSLIKEKFITIIAIMGLLASIGCGYHLRADGMPLGIAVESIAIPLITSTSSVKGFEADFTGMIREEFISHAAIPVVRTEDADVVLTGRIYEIRSQPLTYDTLKQEISGRTITHETTSSRRLKVKLDARLTEKMSGRDIWRDNAMEEDARFDIGSDPLINRYNEQTALKKIAERLAKRLYLKTMERF